MTQAGDLISLAYFLQLCYEYVTDKSEKILSRGRQSIDGPGARGVRAFRCREDKILGKSSVRRPAPPILMINTPMLKDKLLIKML